MAKTVNLTPALLRRIVNEEKQKLVREAKKKVEALAKAEEVDADGYADTLEAPKDHQPKNENRRRYQRLVVQENELLQQLQQIRESKKKIVRNSR